MGPCVWMPHTCVRTPPQSLAASALRSSPPYAELMDRLTQTLALRHVEEAKWHARESVHAPAVAALRYSTQCAERMERPTLTVAKQPVQGVRWLARENALASRSVRSG